MQLEFVFRVRDPTSKFFGFEKSYGMANLVKRTVLYLAVPSKNLDIDQLTLNMNSNTLN